MIKTEKWDRAAATAKVLAIIGHTPTAWEGVEEDTTVASLLTPSGLMLKRLEAFHPTPIERTDLMKLAGISVKRRGGISAYASFHCIVDRINDELHRYGWEIGRMSLSQETYALVKWSRPR